MKVEDRKKKKKEFSKGSDWWIQAELCSYDAFSC